MSKAARGKDGKRIPRQKSKTAKPGSWRKVPGKKITKQRWPKDPDKRREVMEECIPYAITDYDGCLSAMGEALRLEPVEIKEVIEEIPRLKELFDRATANRVLKLIDRAYTSTLEKGTPAQVLNLLKAMAPDQFGDVKEVHVSGGFGPPPGDETALGSVLSIVGSDDEE